MSMAPRASDWAGSFAMTLPGTLASPVRCNRYNNDEKPLPTAICSARTPVTVAPSTRVSHLPSSSSTVEGTTAVADITIDPAQTNDTEELTESSVSADGLRRWPRYHRGTGVWPIGYQHCGFSPDTACSRRLSIASDNLPALISFL